MQSYGQNESIKKNGFRKNKYASLNEESSLKLLAEIIANRIIYQILYYDNTESSVDAALTSDGETGQEA